MAALQSKASGRYGLPECWLYAGAGQTYEIFNREVEEPIVKALSASLRLDAKSRAQLVRGDIVLFKFPLDQSKRRSRRVKTLSLSPSSSAANKSPVNVSIFALS